MSLTKIHGVAKQAPQDVAFSVSEAAQAPTGPKAEKSM